MSLITSLVSAFRSVFCCKCVYIKVIWYVRHEVAATILDSSMVEHSAVNRRVAGSSPARGAVFETDVSNGFVITLDKSHVFVTKSQAT